MLTLYRLFMFAVALSVFAEKASSQDVRIKDISSFRGNRANSLTGFGLIVGLNQTGDTPDSFSTGRALSQILSQYGMQPDNNQILTQAAAAVLVTAELPAFAPIGSKVDLKVSVIGNASSLAGGTLIYTPLKAADGKIYVLAEGNTVIGQASGKGPSTLTSATIPMGGMVERAFEPEILQDGSLDLLLAKPDFTTSDRISRAINQYFRENIATAESPSLVKISVPANQTQRLMSFISEVELLTVAPDMKAIVLLNEKTGTIVMGGDVTISDVVVSHNGLSIQVGKGKEAKFESVVSMSGTTVNDLVKSLNQMGVKPADLISIFQAIHSSGALRAELKVM